MVRQILSAMVPLAVALVAIVVLNWNVGDSQKVWQIFAIIFTVLMLLEISGYLAIEKIYRTSHRYTLYFHIMLGGTYVLFDVLSSLWREEIDWAAINAGTAQLSLMQRIATSDMIFLSIAPAFLVFQLIFAIGKRRMNSSFEKNIVTDGRSFFERNPSLTILLLAITISLVSFVIFT